MKAYVYECPDNSWQGQPGTGRITPEYQDVRNMRRYYLKTLPVGRIVMERLI